jgi:hypothetical protein
MIYRYNNNYYITRARKLIKSDAFLDPNGEVSFKPSKVIELVDIDNILEYDEVTLDDVKKDLIKKSSNKEDKSNLDFKKVEKFSKKI